MTVLNTNYTSLEDAWGSNFDVVERRRPKKSKSTDPLCELYSRRNRKSKKPYSTSMQKPSKYSAYNRKHASDMNKYYGYSDEEMYRTNGNNEMKDAHFLGNFESGECGSLKPSKPVMDFDDDDDDAYLDNAVLEEKDSKDFKY